MGHLIETMGFVGAKPWHFEETKGKSKEFVGAATWEELCKVSGLTWKVEMEEVKTVHGTPMPGWRAITRHFNGKRNVLGMASSKYVPIQPMDLGKFLDGVAGEKLATYETAGSLIGGRRVWALVKLPGELRILKDDVVEKYVMLTTAFDGITSAKLIKTPIRVVCNNTLTAAMAGAGREDVLRIRHRGDIKANFAEARKLLGISLKYYDTIGQGFQALAGFQMKSVHVAKFFDALLPVREQKVDPQTKKAVETLKGNAGNRATVLELAEKGKGADLKGVRGTAWGMYNAFTEFVDHNRKTKTQVDTEAARREARLNSQWFGLGQQMKAKAFSTLMDVVK